VTRGYSPAAETVASIDSVGLRLAQLRQELLRKLHTLLSLLPHRGEKPGKKRLKEDTIHPGRGEGPSISSSSLPTYQSHGETKKKLTL